MKIKFEFENDNRRRKEKSSWEMRVLKIGALILTILAIVAVILYKAQDILEAAKHLAK